MSGDDARLVITVDPMRLPSYATHPWLKPGAGNTGEGEHVEIPTRVGWADVTLTLDRREDGTREAMVTFTPVNPDLPACRLPYGPGVERIAATDPDNAQALAQYAHTLAAQGQARITPRNGRGSREQHDGKQQEEGLVP